MKVSDLINRLDIKTLEDLVGKETLIKLIELNISLMPSELKKRICNDSFSSYILNDYKLISKLIPFLNTNEKNDFENCLKINPCSNEVLLLKLKKCYDDNEIIQIYNFFEVQYIPKEKIIKQKVNIIAPDRSLRDYQALLLNNFKVEYNKQKSSRVLLHLPTGAGKTRIAIRFLCDQMVTNQCKFLWLANDSRLLNQAEEEFENSWKNIGDTNSYQVRIDRNTDLNEFKDKSRVGFFSTVQTYYEMLRRDDKNFRNIAELVDIVVFDEAHRIMAKTYKDSVESICFYSTAFLIGLTATPGRSNLQIEEDRKLAEFFSNNKIKLSTKEFGNNNPFDYLIKEKILAKPIFSRLEYDPKVISKISFIFQKIQEVLARYRRILIFCEDISETEKLAQLLRLFHEKTYTVHSENSDYLNDLAISKLKSKTDTEAVIVINSEMLTTGFDSPGIDCIIIAKQSNSIINFSQMVGRGLRGPNSGGVDEVMIFHIQDLNDTYYFDLEQMFNFWEGVWND